MIVKKTKQLGSFKRGINLYVPKKRIVSAAPSGIPVATTTEIYVFDPTFFWGQANYIRAGSEGSYYYTYLDQGNPFLEWADFRWQLIDRGDSVTQLFNTSQNQNINFVPTQGWPDNIIISAV